MLILLTEVRERKKRERRFKKTCGSYFTLDKKDLAKVCRFCRYAGTENCPKKDAEGPGLTTVVPFRKAELFAQ